MGKYLLAQDEGGIHVLTREPLAVLFYVPAPNAHVAEFTPDSQSFVFHTRSLRVETWNIHDQSRSAAHEVVIPGGCIQSELSFDGKTLACLNMRRDLVLLDAATSTVLATKKEFFVPSFFELLSIVMTGLSREELQDFDFIRMKFSPDNRYFVAGHMNTHFAFDLTSKHEVSLPGSIKDHVGSGFSFLGPDRIVVVHRFSPAKSEILKFPSGEKLDQIPLGTGLHFRASTDGSHLFVGPLKAHALGVMDLKTKLIPVALKRPAGDLYDNVLVNERLDGEIALYPLGKKDPIAVVTLPEARLGKLRAAAVSHDLDWVAISNRSRGALYNIPLNLRTQYVQGFQGAWFLPGNVLIADFPKILEEPRTIGTLASTSTAINQNYKLDEIVATQHGGFLVVTVPKGNNPNADRDIEIRDIATNKAIWTHHFAYELPTVAVNSEAGTMLLGWSLAQSGGRAELQNFSDLKKQAGKEDYLFEVVDLHSGSTQGKVLVKTNRRSVRLEGAVSDGEWVVVSATENQILTFSLRTGEEKGHLFGGSPQVLSSAGLLALEKDARELDLYDLGSLQLKQKYVFADPIALKQISEDGKKLFVLTTAQTAYLFDTVGAN